MVLVRRWKYEKQKRADEKWRKENKKTGEESRQEEEEAKTEKKEENRKREETEFFSWDKEEGRNALSHEWRGEGKPKAPGTQSNRTQSNWGGGKREGSVHSGLKLRNRRVHFMDKNLFPMSSGASEQASKELSAAECVSKASSGEKAIEWAVRANEWVDERMAQ